MRQSYLRLGKKALIMSGRYAHARQMRRSRREQKNLKNYLGRVYRDILRKCPHPDEPLRELLHLAQRVLTQQRYNQKKLYSLMASRPPRWYFFQIVLICVGHRPTISEIAWLSNSPFS
ncbi:MAG: hypothetical protein GXY54_07450 [Deltaproteobacteria bacterium]|nr:hypothetical protein [Deltaproteobacteria bacterium]